MESKLHKISISVPGFSLRAHGAISPAPRNPVHADAEAAMTRKHESGQALALVAVSLAMLLGFAGLAIDMGVLRYEKHLQQTAADAAAIAAANELRDGSSTGSAVVLAGQNAAAANGFTDNSAGSSGSNGSVSACTGHATNAAVTSSTVLPVCVQINNPPQSGPHNGDSNYVEAYVAASHPAYFMKIFGITNEPVVARAVATLVGESGPDAGCVYATDQSTLHGIGGIEADGTPSVYAPTCGFLDDGGWTTNGTPVNITAGSIGVMTNGKDQGTVTCVDTPTSCPSLMTVPVSDPLAYLQETSYTNQLPSGTATAFNPAQPVPGSVYNGIQITGGNVNFPAGTYVVDGNIDIEGGTVTGNGVTFYVTGGVTVNGAATVQFSAPDSGTFAGILFYQDPSTSSANDIAKFNGAAGSYFHGTLYFPGELVEFGGNFTNLDAAGSAGYTIIVANDVKFFGTTQVTIGTDYSGLPGGVSPIENAILVE